MSLKHSFAVGFIVLGYLLTVLAVGKERKSLSAADAAAVFVIDGLMIWLIVTG